jgi:glycosyltransferase involved in cell wall biosynthesis
MTPQVSVVIQTYNRWDQLRQVLDGYRTQTLPPAAFEVLVCDDASTDQTPAQVTAYATTAPYALRLLPTASNAGPAAARNRGLRAAQAPIVVCTDDDCVPHPALLARHAATVTPTVAAIGHIAWHPSLTVSPFMAFLAPGYRFNFAQITDPQNATYRCFYTANVAFWRATALTLGGFDVRFPYAAFEDIELGYRLHQAGVQLVYDDQALVYHLHAMRLASMLQSQLRNGESAAYAVKKHPALAYMAGVTGARTNEVTQRFYRAAMDYYFIAGLQRGLKEHFGGEWAEKLDDLLIDNPEYRGAMETQLAEAQVYAQRLEVRVAELEAAHRELAAHTELLEDAVRRANPLKNGLLHAGSRLRRRRANRGNSSRQAGPAGEQAQ